jgi:hypothetical protein
MSEALRSLLKTAEGFYPPVISYDRVERWLDGELDHCVAAGLLRPGQPAECVTCRECGETEVVALIENSVTKEMCAYTSCLEVGPVQIPIERLQQWEMSYEQLMDAVFAGVQFSGGREEIVRDRVWRLGRANWGGASRNVYFARGLHRRDAWQVMNQARFTATSVVFVPARLPEADTRIEVVPAIIPLGDVLSWKGTVIHFDHAHVAAVLSEHCAAVATTDTDRPVRKRATRTATIDLLIRHMIEHVKAARDHALTTSRYRGEAELLPRPTKRQLGRMIGVSEVSVGRCFTDPTARELRFLWELAGGLERLLEHGHAPAV